MANSWSCATLLLVKLVLVQQLMYRTNVMSQDDSFYEEYKVTDELNALKDGQCPVPYICRNGKGPECGSEDGSRHVTINCTWRSAGPYMPPFPRFIISRRTFTLDLSHNELQSLDAYSFLTSNLVPINLTHIDLSHNYINSIEAATFAGNISKGMISLLMSHNSLRTFEEGTFDDMPSLVTLDLSHNSIMSMDVLCAAQFRLLSTLNLAHNKISYVNSQCLKAIPTRRTINIDLRDNLIGTMDHCAFTRSDVSVQITDNPLICGCNSNVPRFNCLKLDRESKTVRADTSSGCTGTSKCSSDWSFNITYEPVKGELNKQYTVSLKLETEDKVSLYQVDLLEYINLGNESAPLTGSLLSANSTRAGQPYKLTSSLDVTHNYTVCVRPGGSTSQQVETRCQFLFSPYFYGPNSVPSLRASASILALLYVTMALLI